MPELPEVETVVRGLRDTVAGRTIATVTDYAPPNSIVVSPSFERKSIGTVLAGKTIELVERRGKNILMRLSGDITLWVHLKMTGHFFYLDSKQPINKHDLVIFDFEPISNNSDGCHLRFNDYRRFGRLRLYRNDELWQQEGLARLGPEPLTLPADDFVTLCGMSRRMIKPALLDQSFIAGIGNIYADESLFASRIHPERLTSSLSRKKLLELHGHIQRLLKKAIRLMGTSVDSYSGVNGQAGHFQKYLLAYSRRGNRAGGAGRRLSGGRSVHARRITARAASGRRE